jgi:hypothetical protein
MVTTTDPSQLARRRCERLSAEVKAVTTLL